MIPACSAVLLTRSIAAFLLWCVAVLMTRSMRLSRQMLQIAMMGKLPYTALRDAITSTDAGQTWTPLSRQGQSDFHALTASGRTVYGFDGFGNLPPIPLHSTDSGG